MKYLVNILISSLVSVSAIGLFYNYFPITSGMLGSTLTAISGTQTVKSLPASLNASFNALNADKMELTAWYATTSAPQLTVLGNLSTVGTITNGSWNATVIPVNKGGTGSTTLTTNALMLGNGSNGLQSLTYGISGQFLTSGGAGALPTWTTASIDTSANYSWTGGHTFASTTIDGVKIEIGTAANELLRLDTSGKIPAVDGSQLTNVFGTANQKATTTTRVSDAVDGAVNYPHGLGFTPNWVKISFMVDGDTYYGEGYFDGVNQRSIYNAGSASLSGGIDTTHAIHFGSSGGSEVGTVSVSSTNVTITWAKTSSPTSKTMNILIVAGK